ncbi:MAG: hypothetical protein JNM64_17075 [Chloroflexia bacterium]|nr:hypothetical protein [Chloroflexia bacterium]
MFTARPMSAAPATPVPACTSVRAPQPMPTPTRPAWAGEAPQVTPEPAPGATLDPLVPEYLEHAIARFAACWNTGDWSTVVRGTTPRFLRTAFGTRYDPAALADLGLGPVTLLDVSAPRLWSDQRVAVEVLYQRGPQVVAERWFFLVLHGDALLDEAVPLPLPPLGDRVVLGVETAGFTAPWAWRGAEPVAIPAMPVVVLAAANRTPEPRTITIRAADGAVAGYLIVPDGSEGELGLRELPAGTYELSSAESPGAAPLRLQIGERGE